MRLARLWGLLCLLLLGVNSSVYAVTAEQSRYLSALEAMRAGKALQARQLRLQLANYPLALYLDYYDLMLQPDPARVAEVTSFIGRDPQGLLAGRMKARYLRLLADNQDWAGFLRLSPQAPKSLGLQCRFYQARWNTGQKQEAYRFVEDIWMHDASRPGECSALFDLWQAAGLMTGPKIWQRMLLLASNPGNERVLDYLAEQMPGENAQLEAKRLASLYRQPAQLASMLPPGAKDAASIATLMLSRLARQQPDAARTLLQQQSQRYRLTSAQVIQIEGQIARKFMLDRNADERPWVDQALRRQHSPELMELRLRQAVWESDWNGVKHWVQRITPAARSDVRWTYWLARAEEEQGNRQHAQALYRQASYERSYYGFLAADRVGAQIPLNKQHLPKALTLQSALQRWSAVSRVRELLAIGETDQARAEWTFLMDEVSAQEKLSLGAMALNQGWYDLAVLSSIRAKAWDMLELRFPTPLTTTFQRYAKATGVETSLLYALARQESALYHKAQSPVGASGLMQLMPTTAAHVAKKRGINYVNRQQLIDPDMNIRLGSAYLKELLDNYGGNRVLAAAAYNAGPGRVRQWRRASAGRDMDIWVENIPYRETRNYVQNVLVFNAIYQHQLRNRAGFLTERERTMRY
ncbi:transglycosylase SLT domain-containing protein [Pseudaeromonas sharmana]|uniref:Transglycosylase SLT domain-containing protein n=1 Tax=Pseudaeromonas sharmana TaxID=328412 RepID=A0ABV8CJ33_9GAMM